MWALSSMASSVQLIELNSLSTCMKQLMWKPQSKYTHIKFLWNCINKTSVLWISPATPYLFKNIQKRPDLTHLKAVIIDYSKQSCIRQQNLNVTKEHDNFINYFLFSTSEIFIENLLFIILMHHLHEFLWLCYNSYMSKSLIQNKNCH